MSESPPLTWVKHLLSITMSPNTFKLSGSRLLLTMNLFRYTVFFRIPMLSRSPSPVLPSQESHSPLICHVEPKSVITCELALMPTDDPFPLYSVPSNIIAVTQKTRVSSKHAKHPRQGYAPNPFHRQYTHPYDNDNCCML